MVTERDVQSAVLLMFLGAVGLAAVSYATVAADVPTFTSPYSMTVAAALTDNFSIVPAIAICPVLFLLWSIPLFARAPAIPIRSLVLAGVVWGCGLAWLGTWWREGVQRYGVVHIGALLALNLAVGGVLCWFGRRGRRAPSFENSYAFHWLLFAWLAWGAFPWLGEGI